MLRTELLRYWPRETDVAACIKTDAESASEAVSLAVHQEMCFERREIGAATGGVIEICDERQLLSALLVENPPDARVIIPIVGYSGVGKSHVVRWLHTQLRHVRGHDRRLVIRIPKSTSLRRVLGILLENLQGERYDPYRRELERAQQDLDPERAAGTLCELLAQTLEEMQAHAQGVLLEHPADGQSREDQAFCGMLKALFRNQLLRDLHLVQRADGAPGVVRRLVDHLTVSLGSDIGDDRRNGFVADDLFVGDNVDRSLLGQAEKRALLQLERPDRREIAARILNRALDDAKQALLKLDPTVSDLFDAVREELLADGKELVLLVEDFAVLSGLQRQLLQVIIKEGEREGRQVLCTMRTALAYTSGYIDTVTVLTRAGAEYTIPDAPWNEEEILSRIERLVGAYLNAARLGQEALEEAYERAKCEPSVRRWAPSFEGRLDDEARSTLDVFGQTTDGYSLFPFNRAAIRRLARDGSQIGGRLVYNPRFVIQNVLKKVLSHREAFARGQFPSATFGSPDLPATVVEAIASLVPERELERSVRFLTYWGDRPGTLVEAKQIDPRLYSAFSFDPLGPPRLGTSGELVQPNPSKASAPSRIAETVPAPSRMPQQPTGAVHPTVQHWIDVLERWRHRASRMRQRDARQMRRWIAQSLADAIDWNELLFRPRRDAGIEAWSELIFIPNAEGGEGRPAEDSMVAVCTDQDLGSELASARVQSALLAVVRFHGVYESWNYAGADEDLAAYGALMQGLVPKAREFVRARYFKTTAPWDPTPVFVRGLLLGARALGIEGADRDGNHAALLNAMFQAADPMPRDPDESWAAFTDALLAFRSSADDSRRAPTGIPHLLGNLVGAYQLGGHTVYAVDALRLMPLVEQALKEGSFDLPLPPRDPTGIEAYGRFKQAFLQVRDRSGSAVRRTSRRLVEWRGQMVEWLGSAFDKDELVRELKATIERARSAGLAKDVNLRKLERDVEEFRLSRVKAALDDAAQLEDDPAPATVLSVLGRGYGSVVAASFALRDSFDEFERAVNADVDASEGREGEDPVKGAVNALKAAFDRVDSLLGELTDGAS